MKRARLAPLVVALLVALTLSVVRAAPAPPPKPEKITVMNMGTLAGDPGIATVIQNWSQATGIKIEVIEMGERWAYDKQIAALSTGDASIDVMAANDRWVRDWAAAGWLAPLDDIMHDILPLYPEAVRGSLIYGGKVYASHGGNMVNVLYYRKDLLKSVGYNQPPATWAEFLEIAKKLTRDTDGDGVVDQWGVVFPGEPTIHFGMLFETLLHQLDGRIVTGNRATPNSDKGLQALTAITELRDLHKVAPPGINTYASDDVLRSFKSGKAAMAITWTFMAKELNKPDSAVIDKWGISTIPVLPGGHKSAVFITTPLVLNVASKNKYWCMDFIKAYTSYEGQVLEMTIEPGNIALMPSVYEDPRVADPPKEILAQTYLTRAKWQEIMAGIKEGIQNVYVEHFKNQGEVDRILHTELNAALSGTKSPKKALDDAARQMDPLLK